MFSLTKLPYKFDAYEPYIDAKTMELHYTKHHQAYLDKFNKAIEGTEMGCDKSLMDIITHISKASELIKNNAGGYHNHNLFFSILTPAHTEPAPATSSAIQKRYGNFLTFKQAFTEAALNNFGSGWVWLSRNKENELFISTTPNQDNPAMDIIDIQQRGIPVLGLDLWEHAYYLQYQNRRAEYVEAFWNLVNWNVVDERFKYATF